MYVLTTTPASLTSAAKSALLKPSHRSPTTPSISSLINSGDDPDPFMLPRGTAQETAYNLNPFTSGWEDQRKAVCRVRRGEACGITSNHVRSAIT